MADADAPARALAEDNGNNIITVSEADAAAWGEIVNPIYESWVAEMNEKGIDGQALIDQARAFEELGSHLFSQEFCQFPFPRGAKYRQQLSIQGPRS